MRTDTINFRYRVMDMVAVIESYAVLADKCKIEEQKDAITARVVTLLEEGWTKYFMESLVMPHPTHEWQAFWDAVCAELKCNGKVHTFYVHYGENVNPPGDRGNVRFHIQPRAGGDVIFIRLKLIGSLTKEEADLVWEKVEGKLLTSAIEHDA